MLLLVGRFTQELEAHAAIILLGQTLQATTKLIAPAERIPHGRFSKGR